MPQTSSKKSAPLCPAYLAIGDDALKRKAVENRLARRVFEDEVSDFDYVQIQGKSSSGPDITLACNTLPILASCRVVVVYDTESLSKNDAEALVSYLAQPNEQCVLLLTAEKLAKNTRLYKAVAALGKNAVIDCSLPKKQNDLISMIAGMAKQQGCTISDDAAHMLFELIGADTLRLSQEIEKLAINAQKSAESMGSITTEMVRSQTKRSAEIKPWIFVDALSSRNVESCESLYAQISTSEYALLSMCVTRVRELIAAKNFDKKGGTNALASYLGCPDWRVKNHLRWAKMYSEAELKAALVSAVKIEMKMKSGEDSREAFRRWYLSVL